MSSKNKRPNSKNQSNGKYTIIAAVISGICVIIAAIIGIFPNLTPSNLTSSNLTDKKISIFDLDTFDGIAYWFDRSKADSNLTFIDTYDNEYSTGYFGCTRPSNKDQYSPTYLLDKKYSVFEGQLAWSKISKNIEGKVWLEFYSGNDLIYQTDAISATDRIITFEFDVKDVETLTIVANGSNPPLYGITVIYPYLNLISK